MFRGGGMDVKVHRHAFVLKQIKCNPMDGRKQKYSQYIKTFILIDFQSVSLLLRQYAHTGVFNFDLAADLAPSQVENQNTLLQISNDQR